MRARRLLIWTAAGLVTLPVLAVTAFAVGEAPPASHGLLEQLIEKATGGLVTLDGLSGSLAHLRVARLEIRDAQGAWLVADGVVLDWHPLDAIRKEFHADLFQAASLHVRRLPASSGGTSAQAASPSPSGGLPVHIIADQMHIGRVTLDPAVLGTAATIAVDGSLDLASLDAGTARLALRDLEAGGLYKLDGRATAERIDATLAVAEPEGGLISRVAHVPALGALKVAAAVNGPRSALATTLAVAAGPLQAKAAGTLDLAGQAADLQVDASAPAMTPAPDLAWQSIQLQARVHGAFAAPDASGHLAIEGLTAGGGGVQRLEADLAGNAGRVTLRAVAEAVRIPGPDPSLLAASPVRLDAAVQLSDPARPATFSVSHPLLALAGQAKTAGTQQEVSADLTLNRLAPFAAIGGVDLQGSTTLHLHGRLDPAATTLDADGTLSVTGGLSPVPGLIGDDAAIGLTARLAGDDLTLSRFTLAGRSLKLAAQGSRRGGTLDAHVSAGLADLAVVAPSVTGAVQAEATVQGAMDDLSLAGTLTGEVGAPGVPRGPVKVSVALHGLPTAPNGAVTAEGTLEGAPLSLAVHADRAADGTVDARIDRADWRSLHADGALRLPAGATLPLGQVQLRIGQLGDLRPFVGQPVAGSVAASLQLDPGSARVTAQARDLAASGSRIGRADIDARVTDPLQRPVVQASATLDGIAASGVAGSAKLEVRGPQEALSVRTSASLDVQGAPAQIDGAAVLDVPGKTVRLQALQAAARGETARLLAPATIRFGSGVAVDRLRVGLRQAVLDVAGELSPRLNATLSLRTPADLVAIVRPELAMDGALNLDARLSGTPAQPGGSIRLAATGLHLRAGPGRALPPATVTATAQLAGQSAQVEARLVAGSARLALTGRAPLGAGPVDLHTSGSVDLALLNPIVSAAGRQVRGQLDLDASVTGALSAPRIAGSARLARGELADYAQGVRLTGITASLRADGQTVRIESLTAQAGPGTIAATGSIGALAPGLPLDVAITARNARPLSSDLLTANLDADLTLRGPALGAMQAAGKVLIRRAEIGIPERLPASVAVLHVRRPGETERQRAAAGPAPTIDLNLTVNAPGQVFVRGRGVDAELSGELRLRGSSSQPQVAGGFDMRRGTISVAGATLDFTHGRVGFDGTGTSGRIDPTLDFTATNTVNSVTATLAISGYASAPKIALTSSPELPQDEVLSYLLFRRSVKELGPFQIAEIAAALASLTGAGGGVGDPLNSVRQGLGLDRLSVGGGSGNSGPTLEAGRYVANGVYVGAKQGTSGGTGAQVQIDITKGLKLQTDVGSGQGGNQVGVTYQFEY